MANNFFAEEDENEPFLDIPDEVGGQDSYVPNVKTTRPAPTPPPKQVVQEAPEEEYQEENSEEEDFSAVLNDARFRLEQGRLYEMLMNHDIFGGTDADEKAIKYVTKQIRNFAKEQMEIMLGMRQETPKIKAMSLDSFPFNDLEVQVLKALASTATSGATTVPEAQSFSGIQAQPRKAGLNQISVKPTQKLAQQTKPAVKPAPKPLQQKPQAPIKRAKDDAIIEKILAEEGVTREEYDRTFGTAPSKPFNKMNDEELKERNRQIAERSGKRATNPQALPQPSDNQMEMIYGSRVQNANANPAMQKIMGALLK